MSAKTPPPAFDPEPATVADVMPDAIYRLRVLARLVGCTEATCKRNGVKLAVKKSKVSPNRLYGWAILEYVGFREIDRANRTSEGGESEAARAKRAERAMERLRAK